MSEDSTPEQDPCAECDGMSRGRFLNWLLGAGAGGLAGAIAYPAIRYVIPPDSPESESNSVVLPLESASVKPNSGQIFKFGDKPGILIRTPAGELRAFSAVCTHLACTVQYREDLQHIWCACHNGHFNLNGVNIAGPPPSPLPRYEVRDQGDAMLIRRGG